MVGYKDLSYSDFFNYYEGLDKEVKDAVLFLQVPFNHLVALYRHCCLFVFPSYAEGFGIPPIEALAYGAPLLCSNSTAMAEFELPKEISFDPCEFDELKIKMKTLLANPLSQGHVAKSVLGKYNWQVIADNYYKLLLKID